jgi:uncharacterized HAD superfamily protein
VKVALVDIDGPVADNSARENFARIVVQSAMKQVASFLDEKESEDLRKKIFYHEAAFYRPDKVLEDKLVHGAQVDLFKLHEAGYEIRYLTSRPDHLFTVTGAWLKKQQLPVAEVLCKHMGAFRFIRSDLWKEGVVEILIRSLNISHLIFVDDEEKNRTAVIRMAEQTGCRVQVSETVQEAVRSL